MKIVLEKIFGQYGQLVIRKIKLSPKIKLVAKINKIMENEYFKFFINKFRIKVLINIERVVKKTPTTLKISKREAFGAK